MTAHSVGSLGDAFAILSSGFNRIINNGAENYDEISESARTLVIACKYLRDGLYREQASQELTLSILKERINPIYQADALIEMLAHPRMHCIHGLKKELSIASRFLIELTALQCKLKRVRIRQDTIEEIAANMKKALRTLPVGEVVTRFELECCLSAIKKFDIDSGTKVELRDKHVNQISLAVIRTVLTAKPTPPFVSFQYLIPAVVDLTQDLYNFLEEPWYKTVWLLRWHSAEVRIRTLEDLGLIETHLVKYQSDHRVAFYISQLFFEVINNPHADDELKNSLICGGRFSLTKLAEHTRRIYLEPTKIGIDKPRYQDTFWRTRYQALIHLRSLVQARRENLYALDQIAEIAIRRMHEDKKEAVVTCAAALVADIGVVNQELIAEKSRVLIPISSITHEIPEIEARIAEIEQLIAAEFPENNSSSEPEITRAKIENDYKFCLELREEAGGLIQTRLKTDSLINEALATGHWDISTKILQLGGDKVSTMDLSVVLPCSSSLGFHQESPITRNHFGENELREIKQVARVFLGHGYDHIPRENQKGKLLGRTLQCLDSSIEITEESRFRRFVLDHDLESVANELQRLFPPGIDLSFEGVAGKTLIDCRIESKDFLKIKNIVFATAMVRCLKCRFTDGRIPPLRGGFKENDPRLGDSVVVAGWVYTGYKILFNISILLESQNISKMRLSSENEKEAMLCIREIGSIVGLKVYVKGFGDFQVRDFVFSSDRIENRRIIGNIINDVQQDYLEKIDRIMVRQFVIHETDGCLASYGAITQHRFIEEETSIDKLVEEIKSKYLDGFDRGNAAYDLRKRIKKVAEIPDGVAEILIEMVSDGRLDQYARVAAASALKEIAKRGKGISELAMGLLVEIVKDTSLEGYIRGIVAEALGEIAKKGKVLSEAVMGLLVEIAKDTNLEGYIRGIAAKSLGLIAQETGERAEVIIGLLVEMVKDETWDEFIRLNAALSLGEIAQGGGVKSEVAMGALIEIVKDVNLVGCIRESAVTALKKIAQGRGVKSEVTMGALIEIVKDVNLVEYDRGSIAKVLREIALEGEMIPWTATAIEALVEMVKDANLVEYVRVNAVLALGEIVKTGGGISEVVMGTLIEMVMDVCLDEYIRRVVAEALVKTAKKGGVFPEAVMGVLIEMVMDMNLNKHIRGAVAKILEEITKKGGVIPEIAMDSLVEMLKDVNLPNDIRRFAIRALGRLVKSEHPLSFIALRSLESEVTNLEIRDYIINVLMETHPHDLIALITDIESVKLIFRICTLTQKSFSIAGRKIHISDNSCKVSIQNPGIDEGEIRAYAGYLVLSNSKTSSSSSTSPSTDYLSEKNRFFYNHRQGESL